MTNAVADCAHYQFMVKDAMDTTEPPINVQELQAEKASTQKWLDEVADFPPDLLLSGPF